jgi:hypothetical protein
MRKTIQFSVFGNNYRTRQFAAANGIDLLCSESGMESPVEMLSETEVLATNGWVSIGNSKCIDDFVKDAIGFASPTMVLDALCEKIYTENFGFLANWKPVKIPKRLVASIDAEMESPRMDPVISLVVMSGKATLKELEEYYSTEDVFKMYDMIAVDNLNKALGSEAAMAESKSRRGRR